MVDSKNPNTTTQLPISTQLEKAFMHGTAAQFKAAVMDEMLVEVPLNKLERMLMEKYLDTPQDCAEKVTETLYKVKERIGATEQRRAKKQLDKVIPLFEKHEFWSTQPVMRVYEPIGQINQPVESKKLEDISKEGLPLIDGYAWCTINMESKEEQDELYDLLSNHYVEDDGGNFRFDYSREFLKWALTPPGYKKEWLVGVRGGKKNKLYGFISGIPVKMMTHGQQRVMAEINFLCVHKQLRSFRLAPVLIREITRRVNLKDIWQAIYTSGTTLMTPFGSAVYWHRNLNPQKTVDVGFAYKPPGKTMSQFVKLHRLDERPQLDGIRVMEKKDIPEVTVLLNNHLRENYKVHIVFDEKEAAHWLMPQKGVFYSYVVQGGPKGEITDLLSYYELNSHVLNNNKYDKIQIGYASYSVAQNNDAERLKKLFKDALILAKKDGFDVFNVTEVCQHKKVLQDLMFKVGDGKLHHYIYNWKVPACKPEDIGIILM